MSKKRVKLDQPELGDGNVMPGPDEVGVLGKEYLNRCDELDVAKEKKQSAGDALVRRMRESKRQQIRVDGVLILLRHMDAADLLKVKHAKNP
jgi:hypothetical protein